jgi:hypothetical protein
VGGRERGQWECIVRIVHPDLVPDSKISGTRFETICLKCKFYSGPALVNYFALFRQKIAFIENLLTEKHAESRGDNPVFLSLGIWG